MAHPSASNPERKLLCQSPVGSGAFPSWRSRTRSPRRTGPEPSLKRLDCSVTSQQPPVPIEQAVAEEEGEQPHAAQEDAKRHFIVAINHLGRPPASTACLAQGSLPAHEAARPL